ncbi:MAG: VCBS repeat-containing protein, partial [Candidatus Omnitrophica bacterium]|nr:VCBS repeat-containing protein [Candidatus Omnitrophota bacterium]
FHLNGNTWTMTGASFSNDGTVRLQGGETITGLTQDTNSGAWDYVGNGDGVIDTFTLKDFGTNDYFNLMVNDPNVTKDVFAASSALDLNGSFTFSNGTFTAPSAMNVAGNWTKTGGTFTPGTGTVTFDGTTNLTSGGSAFNNVAVAASSSVAMQDALTVKAFVTNTGSSFTQGTSNLTITGNVNLAAGTFTKAANASTVTFLGDLVLGAGNNNLGHVIVGSSPDTITLTGDLTATDLVVNAGDTLVTDGFDVTLTDFLTIQATGALNATNGNGGFTTITVGGNWTNQGTFTASNSTVVFNGTNQTIFGSTTFNHFTKTTAAPVTLTFEQGQTQTFTGTLTLRGASGNLLTLRSSLNGTQTRTDPQGARNIAFVDVKDNNNIHATVINASNSVDSGNNVNWFFSTLFTWTGAVSTNWGTAGNWDLGTVPASGDSVTIPDVVNDPILDTARTVSEITLAIGANLTLSGQNFTITGQLNNGGTLRLYGSETVSLNLNDTDSGTWEYLGDGDGISEIFNLKDFGNGVDYFNLTINDANGTKDTFNTASILNAAGALTLQGGTLAHGNNLILAASYAQTGGTFSAALGAVDVSGNFSLSGGDFFAPSGRLEVSGNFSHTGGTFNHNQGTVVLDGANQTITGTTTFNNFYKVNSSSATLTFPSGVGNEQVVVGTLVLQGASGNLLLLRSSSPGTQWRIDPQAGRGVSYVDVQDSNNINATVISAGFSTDSGNNTNWTFTGGAAAISISGTLFNDKGATPLGSRTVALVFIGSGTADIVTGAGSGGGPHVRAFNSPDKTDLYSFFAYDAAFSGGARVASADVNGDGKADIITGAGPGGGPHVRVFDGVTGAQLGGTIGNFFAYDPAFTGGIFVGAGDVNGDGKADVITGASTGGGPHVKVFNAVDGSEIFSFFAYDSAFTGGVRVAGGDVTGDGRADIITGAGSTGGPHVKVFNGTNASEVYSFFAYDPAFTGGVFVGAGDINGDGRADILTGAGAGGGPHVRAFDAVNLSELYSFYAYDPAFSGGVHVAGGDVNGDGRADIVTGAGPGAGPHVRVFDGTTGIQVPDPVGSFFAYAEAFAGGVYVGAGDITGTSSTPTTVTTVANGSGVYTFSSVNVSSGSALGLYIDNAGEKAVTVSKANGLNLSGIDLYRDTLIIRSDFSTAVTSRELDLVDNAGDADVAAIYTMSGNNLNVVSGKELFIAANQAFTPGGSVSATNMDVRGAYTQGSGSLTVSGAYQQNSGSFIGGSGAISFGTMDFNAGTFTSTSGTLTLNDTSDFTGTGTFVHNSGTVQVIGNKSYAVSFNGATFN